MNPYACHCTDCQTRTGSAFSEHMLVAKGHLEVRGELDVGRIERANGAISSIYGCQHCKTRIYAESNLREGFVTLRCGTLDQSIEVEPVAHLWVRSKQSWVILPDGATQLDEQPQSNDEWMKFVGLVEQDSATM